MKRVLVMAAIAWIFWVAPLGAAEHGGQASISERFSEARALAFDGRRAEASAVDVRQQLEHLGTMVLLLELISLGVDSDARPEGWKLPECRDARAWSGSSVAPDSRPKQGCCTMIHMVNYLFELVVIDGQELELETVLQNLRINSINAKHFYSSQGYLNDGIWF